MLRSYIFFFFNDTATTEIYTLSLHDALPIWTRQTWRGLAMPVVSARPTARAPMSTRRRTTLSRCGRGTSPSNGQPNEVEMAQPTGTPARSGTRLTAVSFWIDSAIVLFTVGRVWVSLAEAARWV